MYLWTETFSLERLCGMYIRTEMFSGDWLCGMYLRPETISPYSCIFLALSYVFPYLSARRSHTTSFCRACVLGGHIPDDFWVVWEGPPYRPHSLGDGSKCHREKGLKTVCLGYRYTSDKGVFERSFSNKCLGEAAYILGIKIYRDRSRRLITFFNEYIPW